MNALKGIECLFALIVIVIGRVGTDVERSLGFSELFFTIYLRVQARSTGIDGHWLDRDGFIGFKNSRAELRTAGWAFGPRLSFLQLLAEGEHVDQVSRNSHDPS